jgi:anthranilate phosphoribosyltransferase
MREQLEDIVSGKKLSVQQSRELMLAALHESTTGAQIAALLAALRVRGVTADELDGFSQALMDLACRVDLSPLELVDVCGTGGDSRGTFNISTATAFVLAGAGCRVAKHGNYAVSSSCGSSNVLEELGVKFSSERDVLARSIDAAGVCFLHAPLFHPALKRAAPVRKELGVRTVFNMLGPLVNPAAPSFQMNGVYDREVLRLYGAVLRRRGRHFAALVSADGHDEVTLTAPLSVITHHGELELLPQNFGLGTVEAPELAAGRTVRESADIVVAVLEGRGTRAQEDVVAASAALAMFVRDEKRPLEDHVEAARVSIRSGKALAALKKSAAL